jgi:MFS family permease
MQSILKYLAIEGNIRVLAIQNLISQLGFGMVYVVWQPYILSTGVSVTFLGFVQTVISFSTMIGLLIWGVLSDRYGRKPITLIGGTCRTLAIGALIISGKPVFLILFAFFIGMSSLWMQGNPARTALIMESVEETQQGTAYGTLMALSQIMSTIMASAGGYIALVSGYSPIFYITFISDALGLLILWKFLKETHIPSTENQKNLFQEFRKLLKFEGSLKHFYAITIIAGISYGVGFSILSGAIVDTLKFNTFQLGLTSTVFNLTWALSSVPGGKLVERIGHKKVLMISTTMSLATILGYLLFKSFEAYLLISVISALDPSLWIPAWVSLLSKKLSSIERSTVMGKLDAYSRLAGIPGPTIAGILYSKYGFNAPLLVHLAGMIIFSSLVFSLKID